MEMIFKHYVTNEIKEFDESKIKLMDKDGRISIKGTSWIEYSHMTNKTSEKKE
jgi:hypothetical protein